jgi:hypothetical protein
MATAKEIKEHLRIALEEVGEIKPWYDKRFKSWIFSHPAYPVEYAGDSKDEVIKNYPLYLREFIKERLNANLSPLTEKETKGRGGKREGAGRPVGTKKESKTRVYLPKDIATWIKQPEAMPLVRQLMHKHA